MSERAIFPDCVFPEDCECAKRGYEHETDHCLVPGVAGAAGLLGVPAGPGLFGGKVPPDRGATLEPAPIAKLPIFCSLPLPKPEVVPGWGSALRLTPVPREHLARALRDGIKRIGYEAVMKAALPSLEEIERLQRWWSVGRGLRAEAGYGNDRVETLAHVTRQLQSGKRVMLWLMIFDHRGDCLAWQIAVKPGEHNSFISSDASNTLTVIEQIVRAGGGIVGEPECYPIKVPSEADLRGAE